MEEGIKFFVGLDVHKDSIAIGIAASGREPAKLVGTIAHDISRLRKRLVGYGDPRQVHVVYEAGPTGYGLQRALRSDRALADPQTRGGAGEDRSPGLSALGGTVAGGGIAGGVGSGPGG